MQNNTDKKTVKTFAWASFLNDLGSDMVFPLWPMFVTTVLGANMMVLGLLDGLGDAIVSVSQALAGYLSDRTHKRKVFIWVGYLMAAVSRFGYALSPSWQWLVPFKAVDRAGKIRGAPRDAMVADASTDKNRGANFGFLRAMDHAGAVCGIIASLILFGILGYKKLFLLAAIPSLLAVALVYFIIQEEPTAPKKLFQGFTIKDLSANYWLMVLLSAIFALGYFSYSFLMILANSSGIKAGVIPVLYLLFTLVSAVSSIPAGKLSDKIGRKWVLWLSFLLWGLVCVVSIYWSTVIAVVIIFILYGLNKGLMEPAQKALVSELSPKEMKASGIGTYQMIIGLMALPGSLIAGLLWEKVGMTAPFYFSLSLTIIASALLFGLKEKKLV